MTLKNLLGFTTAAVLSTAALAANHVDLYFVPVLDVQVDDAEADGNGLGVRGQFDIGESLFLTGEYQTTEFEYDADATKTKNDLNTIRAGGGITFAKYEKTNVYARVEAVNLELGSNDSETGFGLHTGLHYTASPQLNLNAEVGLVSVDGAKGPEFSFGARQQLATKFSVFTNVRVNQFTDDSSGTQVETDVIDLRLGGGYHF